MENEEEDDLELGMEQSPMPGLNALAPSDTRAFLLQQAQQREAERSKLFQAELDRIETAKKNLLAKPTELSRREALREIASRLAQRPSDPRDPRFFEKRNLLSTLRDIGQAGGEISKKEKEAKLQQQAQIDELEALRGKYMYGAAEKSAAQARSDLARYREPTPPRLQASAQKILDLQSIVDDESKPEQARNAAQREINKIGQSLNQQDRSTLGQIIAANKMLKSKDPEEVATGKAFLSRYNVKPPALTVGQKREDLMIQGAVDFLKTIPQQELDAALRSISINRTPKQERIIKAWELSQRPTFGSAISGSQAEPQANNDLTDEEREELEQLRKELGR